MSLPTPIEDIIAALQRDLLLLSRLYPEIPRVNPDSIYGPETTRSVRAFQKMTGLPETGLTDEATLQRLYELFRAAPHQFFPAPPIQPFDRQLKDGQLSPGDRSELVMLVQIMLNTVDLLHDFGQLELTGLYDEETTARIRLFQQRNLLPETGITDRPTWDMLARAYNSLLNRE